MHSTDPQIVALREELKSSGLSLGKKSHCEWCNKKVLFEILALYMGGLVCDTCRNQHINMLQNQAVEKDDS